MKNKIWAAIMVLTTVITITVNALANILPFNGKNTGQLSDGIPNLFVPAGITFAIWGVIYLFLIIWTIYAVLLERRTDGAKQRFAETVGPWYLISGIANSLWIIAWHWEQVLLSLFIMFLLLFCLIVLYTKVRRFSQNWKSISWETLIARLPISVYLGWITVATVANITAVLVTSGFDGGESALIITIAVLVAVLLIGMTHAWNCKDLGFQVVLIWALAGIANKRLSVDSLPSAPIVGWISLAIAFILGFFWLISVLLHRRKPHGLS